MTSINQNNPYIRTAHQPGAKRLAKGTAEQTAVSPSPGGVTPEIGQWVSTGAEQLANIQKQLITGNTNQGIAKWSPDGGLENWVGTLYQNILGRPPENQKVVNNWATVAAEDGPASVLKQFLNSDEFKSKNLSPEDQVETLYRSILNRPSDPQGKAGYVQQVQQGVPLDYLASTFMNSDEYKNDLANGTTPYDSKETIHQWNPQSGTQGWVTTLYQNILGRDPENQQVVDNWSQATEQNGPAAVVKQFFNSDEFKSKKLSPEDQVELLYRSILQRPAEPSGKAGWVQALKNGMPMDQIIDSFFTSDEYKQDIQKGVAVPT